MRRYGLMVAVVLYLALVFSKFLLRIPEVYVRKGSLLSKSNLEIAAPALPLAAAVPPESTKYQLVARLVSPRETISFSRSQPGSSGRIPAPWSSLWGPCALEGYSTRR